MGDVKLGAMRVVLVQQHDVLPASARPPQRLELSFMDQVMPRLHTQLLYVFRPRPGPLCDLTALADMLRASLAQALVHYYPLAGRLVERADKGLDVDCNGAGAVLIEAQADFSVEDFAALHPGDIPGSLLPDILVYGGDLKRTPILIAQVTCFSCGGFSLGLLVHHYVADGAAMINFVNAWAELARGQSRPSLPVSHDRSLLSPRQPPAPACHDSVYQVRPLTTESSGTWPPALSTLPPPELVLVYFTDKQLQELKKEASAVLSAGEWVSTNDITTALLWQAVTRARGLHETDSEQEVRLGFAVDGRDRLEPPLPAGYFGNANFFASASCKAGVLAGLPVGQAALLVRSTVRAMTNERLRSFLDWVASQETPAALEPIFDFISGPDCTATSWVKFKKLHETDFGWGPPLYPLPPGIFAGFAFLTRGGPGVEDVAAVVALGGDHAARLRNDPGLLPFVASG